ncbi:hypothetical protein BGW39_009058 [Mortierella sp. 14UC]|nr:hypothetical protein BGW39_009058 [Mortierella sp. 14UC]
MHEQFYRDLGRQEAENVGDGNNIGNNDGVNGEDGHDQDIPELARREEPLYNLKKLVAWGMEHSTVSEILSVFDHCPNIDRLKVPSVSFAPTSPELVTLARSISDRCPHLRTLSVLDDPDGPLLVSLMEAMPANQLEAVKINTFEYSGIDLATTRRVFTNHAASLRLVNLRYTTGMSSKDMMVIFEVCAGLEEFKKHPSPYSGDVFITLSDAIAVPWASKKIKHLELTIGIPDLVGVDIPYYSRRGPGPVMLEVQERERFDKLEKFYRQIGGLVELEYLDLRAVKYDPKCWTERGDGRGEGGGMDCGALAGIGEGGIF